VAITYCCENFKPGIFKRSNTTHSKGSCHLLTSRLAGPPPVGQALDMQQDNIQSKTQNRFPSSDFSTVSIISICCSQLGRFPHFLIVLGSRSSTVRLAGSEDDAGIILTGDSDAFQVTPLLFQPLFLVTIWLGFQSIPATLFVA